MNREALKTLLKNGVKEGVFPGAVLLVAFRGEIVFFHATGNRAVIPEELAMERDTIFDLASLTKPLATALAVMKLVDNGAIGIDQPIEDLLPGPIPRAKRPITPRMLLSHAAGFTPWMPFYLDLERVERSGRKDHLRRRLMKMPLVYPPGTSALYSDPGFMILEWIVEEIAECSLPRFLDHEFYGPLRLRTTFLQDLNDRSRFDRDLFAATEACPWRGEVLRGIVHDENAYVLGGHSGHAGLFGNAREVYILTNLLREHYRGEREDYLGPETVKAFFSRAGAPGNGTWALGWDTPSLDNSSAGSRFSLSSVGHLGFTGVSLWLDLEQDVIVVFLTNRVHPTRKNQRIRAFRPRLHDAVMEGLGLGSRSRE